jgi:hypothetical protein
MKYMHSFLNKKFGLDLIENKFWLPPFIYIKNVNLVISLQIMLFGTYNIDKSLLEQQIWYKNDKNFQLQDL